MFGSVLPQQRKSGPVPLEQGVRLDQVQRATPAFCKACKDDQQQPVKPSEPKATLVLSPGNDQLLAQHRVFSNKVRLCPGQVDRRHQQSTSRQERRQGKCAGKCLGKPIRR